MSHIEIRKKVPQGAVVKSSQLFDALELPLDRMESLFRGYKDLAFPPEVRQVHSHPSVMNVPTAWPEPPMMQVQNEADLPPPVARTQRNAATQMNPRKDVVVGTVAKTKKKKASLPELLNHETSNPRAKR